MSLPAYFFVPFHSSLPVTGQFLARYELWLPWWGWRDEDVRSFLGFTSSSSSFSFPLFLSLSLFFSLSKCTYISTTLQTELKRRREKRKKGRERNVLFSFSFVWFRFCKERWVKKSRRRRKEENAVGQEENERENKDTKNKSLLCHMESAGASSLSLRFIQWNIYSSFAAVFIEQVSHSSSLNSVSGLSLAMANDHGRHPHPVFE